MKNILFPWTCSFQEVDGLREAELAGGKIGTTKRGIGPCYASKVQLIAVCEQRVMLYSNKVDWKQCHGEKYEQEQQDQEDPCYASRVSCTVVWYALSFWMFRANRTQPWYRELGLT